MAALTQTLSQTIQEEGENLSMGDEMVEEQDGTSIVVDAGCC